MEMVFVVFYAVGIRKNTILRNEQKYLAMIHKNRKISTVSNNGRFIRYICLGLDARLSSVLRGCSASGVLLIVDS